MKRLLFLVLVLCLCVVPVLGVRENFQSYLLPGNSTTSDLTYITNTEPGVRPIQESTGDIWTRVGVDGGSSRVINKIPTPFTYAAADVNNGAAQFGLLDGTGAVLWNTNPGAWSNQRMEIKMIGMQPTVYRDGVVVVTGPVISQNPSYMAWGYTLSSSYGIDNVVVGESDHHIVGALPTNWTIQRDLLNPSSTGTYAWSGSAWVLQDSTNFYLDADKEFLNPENVVIKDFATQTTVNTTSVTSVKNSITYNISQFLNNPTSLGTSLPDGMYTVSFESSPAITDSFWVTSSGAAVSWDKTKYAGGDSAVLTYVISPAYFTSDYTYKLDVLNMYGTVVNSQVISAASGTKSISSLDATTYPPGVYWAVVRATTVADGTVHDLAVSPMETIAYVLFNGYVMNAENGTVLSGAAINLTQGTSTLTSTSGSGGIWNSSNNWASGMEISITTTLAGYTPDVRLITPLSAKSIALNISLMPIPPTNVSHSIGGIVRDNVYGNPVTGATVTAMNSTRTLTNISNIAGYYRHDNLSMSYNVWGNKSGYANSSIVTKNASVSTFNQTDLIMSPAFLFTGNIIDSVTNAPIPVVSVIDSNAWTTNTTTGTFSNTYNYSVVTFYLSANGYNSRSFSYIIDSNRTETMSLTPATESPSTGQTTWYVPLQVRLVLVNQYGTPVEGVHVTAKPIGFTAPDNWTQYLIGIQPNVQMQGTTLLGVTGSDGSWVAPMLPSFLYQFTFTNTTSGINDAASFYPKDDQYRIWLNVGGATNNTYSQINGTALTFSEPNKSFVTMGMTYQDTSGLTNNVTFSVISQANNTVMYTQTFTGGFTAAAVTSNYTTANIWGYGYVWKYVAYRADGSILSEGNGVTTKGPNGVMVDFGLSLTWYRWISVMILFLMASMASQRTKQYWAILIPVFASIFAYWGWFTGKSTLVGIIILCGVLGGIVYMKSSLREKHGIGGPGTMLMNIVFYLLILQACIGFINGLQMWDDYGNQAVTVSNQWTNVDITQIQNIQGAGGFLQEVIAVGTIMFDMMFSAMKMFFSILISLVTIFPMISSFFPWMMASPPTRAFLALLQIGLWYLYAQFMMKVFAKPGLDVVDL